MQSVAHRLQQLIRKKKEVIEIKEVLFDKKDEYDQAAADLNATIKQKLEEQIRRMAGPKDHPQRPVNIAPRSTNSNSVGYFKNQTNEDLQPVRFNFYGFF